MSIRRTIESLLGDEQQQEAFRSSPETYFADHGMEDVPGELIGTAFVHYSDSAPIEHGDAVAGIATRHSSVPFEEADLPDHDPEAGEEVDPFATLGSLGDATSSDPDDSSADDTDPTDDHEPSNDQLDTADDESLADDGGTDDAASEDAGAEDVSSDSFGDDGFDDGFDELEDGGFGAGDSDGPTEILGEIHGGGTLDPESDDPFFDDVTHDVAPSMPVVIEEVQFETAGLEAVETNDHADLFESFTDDVVETFDDVDPGDLDLDDF